MATVGCPSCGRALEVEDEYRDWTVRCPHCAGEFVPSEVAPSGPSFDEEEERPRPRRRGRRDDDYDDYDDRPRRRRPRYDDDYDDDDRYYYRPARGNAAQMVSGPALWLEICGWGGALVTAGFCVLLAVLAAQQMNNPPPPRNGDDDPGFLLFVSCMLFVVGMPYSVAMAIGARKMRTLSSQGWAMTAAILGVASIAIFSICGVIQTGIGIWALVTLNNPVVQQAFAKNNRARSRRDWDD